MSWGEPLQPIGKVVPRVGAILKISNKGPRIWLSFSGSFYKDIGEPRSVDALPGIGENVGKVRLVLNAAKGTGKFPMSVYAKGGGARVILPAIPGIPEGYEFGLTTCQWMLDNVSNPDKLDVTLPLGEWNEAIAKLKAEREPPKKEVVANGAEPEEPVDMMDAKRFLTSNGHHVSTRRGSLVVDEKVVSKGDATGIINRHLKTKGLPPVRVHDILWP